MQERPTHSRENPSALRKRRLPPGLLAAKWPPDDNDLPEEPPGPGGGGGANFGDEGNFKKGRFNPVTVFVGVLLVAGAAAAIWFGIRQESQKMTVEQIATEKKNIFVLPQKDQIPLWKKWATSPVEPKLQQEALIQLAWADDPEGPVIATKALEQKDHRIRGVASQVLAHYGSPRADGAKTMLLQVLKEADESDKPQIVWALAVLKEPAAFQDAMGEYRKGHLAKVERLGGGVAFDPEKLASMVSLDELAKLATDESASVRQLVATVVSRNPEPKWTDTLIKLVEDKDIEVAREAANGLGRIGDDKARKPLLDALKAADKDSRQRFLEALRDGIGGEGLVLALDSVKSDTPEQQWFQTKQIFEMLRQLADPRSADALVAWVEKTKPPLHWQGEAGTRLAEVGDVRAAKLLGERMLADPTKLYVQERFWEADEGGHLSRTDLPRVVASRMLADLAVIHGDKRDDLKKAAEDSVILWIKDRPQPHANGLRFLATVRSEKIKTQLREWAFPKDPLPKEGAQPPFPMAFETAQSALRYIGRARDEDSFPKLLEQFKRKPDKQMDITQEGLQGAGLAMMGMALRAVAYGAAQGLAEFGDAKAVKPLIEFIEDETWHEEARSEACLALGWSADEKTMLEVAKKAKDFAAKKELRKQWIGACYANALSVRPVPGAGSDLADLLTADVDLGVRMAISRAIGAGGVDEALAEKLMAKIKDEEVRNAAALALILGGSTDIAARTVAMFGDYDKSALDDLKDHYYRAFGYWSDEDFTRGTLFRYVSNAESVARIKVHEVPQDWTRQRLQSQFDNLQYDNGPHSETRVVLRYRLWQAAKGDDAARRKGAIMTLKFMKERGVLMALRQEAGEAGALAKQAFHELMNPKMLPAEDLSGLQPKKTDGDAVNVKMK
ncbi:HEAT repeat domain-containing protein [Chondromyces crocatus]|uniref:HEAT repeat domain-containing protein n=1 Tax=Chondromyces crocatus TaxID=52 RepID=A0A0K1E8X5_CHOCO|nr:HEAT repeat domain-containing protein [Chondromyces crocatus]AKT37033.1 uncharacterized protein CMC5_011590 [Chondromyces crocatus]